MKTPKRTEVELSTSSKSKKPVKVKKDCTDVKPALEVKKKKRTPEQKAKRLEKIKAKVVAEEAVALKLIDDIHLKAKKKFNGEDDHKEVYLDMFRQLRRIIKKTERSCLKSKNGQGAYQLATLYTQLREVLAEIRAYTDLSDHVDSMIERVMKPLFTTLVQSTSNAMYQTKIKIKDKLKEKRVRRTFEDIDEITLDQANQLQTQYDKACQTIREILIGNT
jgi:hypothetical protein